MLKSSKCILVAALTLLLLNPAPIWSQQAPAAPAPTPTQVAQPPVSQTPVSPTPPPSRTPQEPIFVSGAQPASGIKVLVLEGNKGVNRLKEGIFATPVVEVRNSNDLPVEGAAITFRLPAGGPGAVFPGGSSERSFKTNAQGQAVAEGYTPNNLEGKFEVKVSAAFLEDRAEVFIPQSNSFQLAAVAEQEKKNAWKKWLWIGLAGAGGATALAIILTRGSSSTQTPRVGIGVGPIVIGGN